MLTLLDKNQIRAKNKGRGTLPTLLASPFNNLKKKATNAHKKLKDPPTKPDND
jgi:hypothetical protein